MDTLQQIAGVALVLALLGTLLYFLRQKKMVTFTASSLRKRSGKSLELIERISLTPQHNVCLLRVGTRLMLVATAPGSCQVLETPESDSPGAA